MSKAEERALEAYPKDIEEYIDVKGVKSVVDNNSWQRTIFLKGYHQAEKDLELTWEDMALVCKIEFLICTEYKGRKLPQRGLFYQEILKRFREIKKK